MTFALQDGWKRGYSSGTDTLPAVVEEFIYPAMEDYKVDFTVDSGMHAKTINIPLQPFTLIGATTRTGLISSPLRARFGIQHHLEFWSEEDLRRSEMRYRNVFESLLDVYFETTDDGRIAELSPSISALTGYAREELLGQSADMVFRAESLWERLRTQLAEGEQVRDWEVDVATKDGRTEVGSLNATAVLEGGADGSRIRGTVRLISDRKRAEGRLKQSEETSRALLNASFSYALLLDRHMHILAANESLEKAAGVAPGGLAGTSTTDLVSGPLRGFRHSRALEVFYTGQGISRC